MFRYNRRMSMNRFKYLYLAFCLSATSFADDFGYQPFKKGEKFEIAETSWAHNLDGATCDIRIPQIIEVVENKVKPGEVDEVIFRVDNPESPRTAECKDGEKIVLNLIQADNIRINSVIRGKQQAELDQVLIGKSKVRTYQGFTVGDELTLAEWTWAILAVPTQNKTQKFREGDLCRVRENESVTVLGFDIERQLSYFQYHGNKNAEFSDCPDQAIYVIR